MSKHIRDDKGRFITHLPGPRAPGRRSTATELIERSLIPSTKFRTPRVHPPSYRPHIAALPAAPAAEPAERSESGVVIVTPLIGKAKKRTA